MITDKENWEQKLHNLHAREKGITSEHQINYKELLKKVFIGKLVCDIGCGTCWLRNYLPKDTEYLGLDAFTKGDYIGSVKAEDLKETFNPDFCETSFVFAALDGMQDLEKSFQGIKHITSENVVILTGINIEPDLYHTHLITEEFIDIQMSGWKKTVRVQVHPKIIFLEYTK